MLELLQLLKSGGTVETWIGDATTASALDHRHTQQRWDNGSVEIALAVPSTLL